MKKYVFLLLITLSPFLVLGQSDDYSSGFGFTINSGLNGELMQLRIIPGLTYTKGKNQIELGFGFDPYIKKDYRILSIDLNHKFYPNGSENKFNLYFVSNLSYANNRRDTFYPSRYNYVFLNGGFGFEIKSFSNVYVGMNVTAGGFTKSSKSEVPYPSFSSTKMFDRVGANLAFQFNTGYRF